MRRKLSDKIKKNIWPPIDYLLRGLIFPVLVALCSAYLIALLAPKFVGKDSIPTIEKNQEFLILDQGSAHHTSHTEHSMIEDYIKFGNQLENAEKPVRFEVKTTYSLKFPEKE